MNDLVICPRIVAGNFSLAITSLREFSAWFLLKSGDMLSIMTNHDEPITECAIASMPVHTAILAQTADGLRITISRDLPFYVVASRKHAQSFGAVELQNGRPVTHFALPCIELSEYVLDLVMHPGQTVQISAHVFEQVIKVQ